MARSVVKGVQGPRNRRNRNNRRQSRFGQGLIPLIEMNLGQNPRLETFLSNIIIETVVATIAGGRR